MRSISEKWRLLCATGLLGLLTLGFHAGVSAQAYPAKPIKMIVPFPAGGTTDIVARILAQKMSESMGQPVTVDNRGGAGGAIGADLKGKISLVVYVVGIGLTFVSPWIGMTLFTAVAIMWLIPDRRIERHLAAS